MLTKVKIWPMNLYMEEAMSQLNDTACYVRVTHEVVEEIKIRYKGVLLNWQTQGLINDDEFAFLHNEYPKLPVFYLIPKIHKNYHRSPG